MTEHEARDRDVEVIRVLLAEGRELTKEETQRRWGVPPRRMRAAVSALRHQGVPVISASSEGSTYRLARSTEELEAFVRSEIESRAFDLLEQAKALREASPHYFGVAEQLAIAI